MLSFFLNRILVTPIINDGEITRYYVAGHDGLIEWADLGAVTEYQRDLIYGLVPSQLF